jgi:hypothetical protein
MTRAAPGCFVSKPAHKPSATIGVEQNYSLSTWWLRTGKERKLHETKEIGRVNCSQGAPIRQAARRSATHGVWTQEPNHAAACRFSATSWRSPNTARRNGRTGTSTKWFAHRAIAGSTSVERIQTKSIPLRRGATTTNTPHACASALAAHALHSGGGETDVFARFACGHRSCQRRLAPTATHAAEVKLMSVTPATRPDHFTKAAGARPAS